MKRAITHETVRGTEWERSVTVWELQFMAVLMELMVGFSAKSSSPVKLTSLSLSLCRVFPRLTLQHQQKQTVKSQQRNKSFSVQFTFIFEDIFCNKIANHTTMTVWLYCHLVTTLYPHNICLSQGIRRLCHITIIRLLLIMSCYLSFLFI